MVRDMKNTENKSVKSKTGVYAQGRVWEKEAFDRYRKYQIAFTKKNYRTFALRFSREKDAEIIKRMEAQENLVEYLRVLISKDIEKEKKKKKK